MKPDFIFECLTDRDFASGIRGKVAGSMLVQLEQGSTLFTEKQWARLAADDFSLRVAETLAPEEPVQRQQPAQR